MRDPQNKTIDGVTYQCKPLPGWESIGLFFELVGVLGEPTMHMITRAFSEGDVGDADAGEVIGAGVYAFFSKLDADTGTRIMKLVFNGIVVAGDNPVVLGEEAHFNHHFTGGTLEALKVFAWGLQVNYQGFLDGSRLAEPLEAAKRAASKVFGPSAPPTSPTPSQPSASTPMAATT